MKNSILLFSVGALLALSSCAKDMLGLEPKLDSKLDPICLILPTSIKDTVRNEYGIITATTKVDLHYNPKVVNQLDNITYDNAQSNGTVRKVFTYVANRISKVESFSKGDSLKETVTITYQDNKINSKYVAGSTHTGYDEMYCYAYNADGTVTVTEFLVDKNKTKTEISKNTYTLDANRGNVLKNETDRRRVVYEYDSGNNPFKNILGYSLLVVDPTYAVLDPFRYGYIGGINNQTKITWYIKEGDDYIVASKLNSVNKLDSKTNFLTKSVKTGDKVTASDQKYDKNTTITVYTYK